MENRDKTREELMAETEALQKELASLQAKYNEKIVHLQTIEFDLQERNKELNCLHRMLGVMNDQVLTYDEILECITQIIPPAWQFPEQTGACLEVEGKVFKTPLFRSDSPKISETIMIGGRKAGTIEVCLTGIPPVQNALTFLPEETLLLKSIALYVAAFVEKSEKETALYRSEQEYKSILHASPDVITITDMEGRILFSSPRAVEMFGYNSSEKFVGHSLLEYVDPSCHEKAIAGISSMFGGKNLGAEEYIGVRWDGSLFDIEVNGEVIRDEQGNPEKMIFITRDISDRKAAERKLSQSQENYRSLIDSADASIILFDRAGNHLYINDIGAQKLNLPAEKIIGLNVTDFFSPEQAQPILSNLERVYSSNEGMAIEENIEVSGISRWFRTSIQPVRNHSGEPYAVLVFSTDITLPKAAELNIQQSEQKYRIIFETIRDVYYEASMEGMVLELSPSITILTKGQYTREDLIGKPMASFYEDPDYRKVFLDELAKTGSLTDFELTLRNRDGSIIPVSVSSSIIFDENRQAVKITGSLRDVTERKKAEEEMRKFRIIADIANYGIALAGLDGTLLYCNRTFANMHGWEVSEVIGRNISVFHSQEQMGRVLETVELLKKNGQFTSEEVWRTRKDGSCFPSLMNAVIIMENNQPQFMSATAIDITDLKESEKKVMELNANLELKIAERTFQLAETNNNLLKEIEERNIIQEALTRKTNELETFFSVALDLLCIADTSGHFIKVNQAWANILGYSSKDLENRQFLDFVHPEDLQPTLDAMSLLSDQHPILDFTNRYRTKEGTYRYIEWHSVPVGNLIYAAARDITGRIKNEEDLRNARREAERANLAKSEFLSRMSHELRTPMNSILGFAQLLEMGALNPGQKKGVTHILRSGKHLLELINEVLDIARIEAGRISLSLEPVQLSGVIREMIDTVQIIAAEHQISIELIETDDHRLCVKADRQRLKQILLNLLNNAIKYNRKGGSVRIRVDVMPGPVEAGVPVRISVTDTGCGISDTDLPKLFTPFERIGAEKTETEGTGLGLAVVKKLVEVMGGNIGVASIPGEGSTFWFEFMMVEDQLKHYKNEVALSGGASVSNNKKGCMLYIEDNGPNIELVQEILDTSRPEIRLVTTMYGKQAVEFAIEFKPGLILLDLNLPDIHGSEVLQNLLSEEKTKAIPVVVISADALQDQVIKLQKAGARDYLTKPLDVIHFLETVDKYLTT